MNRTLNVVFGSILGLVLLMLLVLYYQYTKIKESDKEIMNLNNELNAKTVSVVRYKTKADEYSTVITAYEKKVNSMNDDFESKLMNKIKSIDVKLKNVEIALDVDMTSSSNGDYDSIVYIPIVTEPNCPDEIRYFDNGFFSIISYPDSMKSSYKCELTGVISKKEIPRTFFLWKLFNMKKTVQGNTINLISNDTNSYFNGRLIYLK